MGEEQFSTILINLDIRKLLFGASTMVVK